MRAVVKVFGAVTLLGGSAAAVFLPGIAPVRANVSGVAASGVARHQAIAFYERRLSEDPHSALDMAQLAAAHLDEGRLTGDERAFVVAESLARRSLGERTRRNGRSVALLVNALLAQHRFGEATTVARDLVQWDAETPAYRALLAEALMEVGDYEEAIGQLGVARSHRADLGIAPRFARWAELTGQPGEARRILRTAQDEAFERPDLTDEQKVWFSVRLADLELRYGRLRGAAQAIASGLAVAPADWRLLLVQARLEAARGKWNKVVQIADEVVAAVPSPDAFALLATAHRELGHVEAASAFAQALEGVVRSQPSAPHRSWALALIDQGSAVGDVVTMAMADTLVRHDTYSLDLLAWALHNAGRSGEAAPLVRRAMRLGNAEPVLRYHAGMIEFATGDCATARQHLEFALQGGRALAPAQTRQAISPRCGHEARRRIHHAPGPLPQAPNDRLIHLARIRSHHRRRRARSHPLPACPRGNLPVAGVASGTRRGDCVHRRPFDHPGDDCASTGNAP
jgi:tetratricopeptide (TPR) repeat protein